MLERMTTSHQTRTRRATLSIIGGLAAVAALSGCQLSYDAWAVTYEVSVTGAPDNGFTDLSFAEADGRNGPSVATDPEAVGATGSPASWSAEAIVTATHWAFVTATPAEGGTATCRVLIDGEREIETQTAPAGEPVTCAVQTPAFD